MCGYDVRGEETFLTQLFINCDRSSSAWSIKVIDQLDPDKLSHINLQLLSETVERLKSEKNTKSQIQWLWFSDLSLKTIEKPFYFSCISDKETLEPIYRTLKEKFSCVYHKDIYTSYQL